MIEKVLRKKIEAAVAPFLAGRVFPLPRLQLCTMKNHLSSLVLDKNRAIFHESILLSLHAEASIMKVWISIYSMAL